MASPTPFFKPMTPEVQALYDSCMQHANNCQGDIDTHESNAMLMSLMMGNHFPGIQRGMAHLAEQSRLLEEEAGEMAYTLLKNA